MTLLAISLAILLGLSVALNIFQGVILGRINRILQKEIEPELAKLKTVHDDLEARILRTVQSASRDGVRLQ